MRLVSHDMRLVCLDIRLVCLDIRLVCLDIRLVCLDIRLVCLDMRLASHMMTARNILTEDVNFNTTTTTQFSYANHSLWLLDIKVC